MMQALGLVGPLQRPDLERWIELRSQWLPSWLARTPRPIDVAGYDVLFEVDLTTEPKDRASVAFAWQGRPIRIAIVDEGRVLEVADGRSVAAFPLADFAATLAAGVPRSDIPAEEMSASLESESLAARVYFHTITAPPPDDDLRVARLTATVLLRLEGDR